MAIADDFTVALNGDIRHASGTAHYRVLELHRWLQDLADDPEASGNDLIDITSGTPSARSTDNIIDLLGTYNIDDDAAEYLYDGSITQAGGDTVYSGLRVLGAVNNSATQLMVIQDNDLYQYTTTPATPFWGDQSTGGYNGIETSGILMRCLIKSREFGADIDGQRIRVQARHWGDTYDFFNVQLGTAESVAAIGTTPDAQNDGTQGTVTAYTHVTNTEGYQTLTINTINGAVPFYSQWTFGADTSGDGLKGIWEFGKDLTGKGTAKTLYGLNGELFLGPTHSYAYNTQVGTFTESETIVWGTDITYGTLAGGTFSAGDYVTIGVSGAAGRVMYDNGSTNMIVALEDPTITLADADVITEASAGTVTAAINVTILNNSDNGGSAQLLAANDQTPTGNHYIQLTTGSAPVTTLPIRGLTSGATCALNGAAAAKTIPKIFLGGYTGSLIGAYGVGFLDTDLTASDTLQDLLGASQTPPNNVTFTVSGLVSGEDYVLVGPKAGGNDFDFTQLLLQTTLNAAGQLAIVTTAAIPTDTPTSGFVRVTLDDGRKRKVAYTSFSGSTFTTAATDWSGGNAATAGVGVMISYIDRAASAAQEAFTVVYLSTRTLWIRVRDGGASPIKTFESLGTLAAAGGSAVASRITDE
jgi:hypothetical protein